jgi:hypothetical protein
MESQATTSDPACWDATRAALRWAMTATASSVPMSPTVSSTPLTTTTGLNPASWRTRSRAFDPDARTNKVVGVAIT